MAQNPIQSPSGEKNGCSALSVPLRGTLSKPFNARRNTCRTPLSVLATNANSLPSSEMARFGSSAIGIAVPAGNNRVERVAGGV